MRKALVCGNWKLNHGLVETRQLISEIIAELGQQEQVDCVVAPVAPFLFAAVESAQNSTVKVAAQNVYHESKGAFTGEWSTSQLLELGCSYAIIGHSERRALFGESDELVAKKVKACLAASLQPIACFGESLNERESGRLEEVIARQVLSILNAADLNSEALILAYEPIWAIGTGKTATAEQAQEVHALVRALINQRLGSVSAESMRILYGGSVTADNAALLMDQPDIDGLLVGGASLKSASFCSIVRSAMH